MMAVSGRFCLVVSGRPGGYSNFLKKIESLCFKCKSLTVNPIFSLNRAGKQKTSNVPSRRVASSNASLQIT